MVYKAFFSPGGSTDRQTRKNRQTIKPKSHNKERGKLTQPNHNPKPTDDLCINLRSVNI